MPIAGLPDTPLIALDCRQLVAGASGDRSYLLGLVRELLEAPEGLRYLLCYQGPGETGLPQPLPPAARSTHFTIRPGWLWTPWAWPRVLRAERAAVAHAQYLIPPLSPCPTVCTIHDVSFLRHPEWFPARQLRIMRQLIPLSARRATRIVTGSHHAAGEITQLLGVPHERLTVIPYGPDPRYRVLPPEAVQPVAQRYGFQGCTVLAVGLIQPRKNLPRLLEAFVTVARTDPEAQLAIVGREGWATEQVKAQVVALGLGEKVVFTGAVPDEDLPALYNAAAVLAYPSLYEGFGLPPVEAMACGTPVVASNTTSLPEVVGEAGLLVDPLDSSALAAALLQVLQDRDLATHLATAGPARVKAHFSWQRCAQAHQTLYHSLL